NALVVINAGGAIDMSRRHDSAAAILMGWYPGQEGGLAIAHMLAGRISPSGRLPMSIEARPEDNPTAESYYPGEPKTKRGFTNRYVTYSEGVFVGYRGYDRTGTKPLYPFGHGLTYSEFVYSDLDVKEDGEGFEVSFTIKNNGKHDAAETPQVYVGATAPSLPRPLKELKGFRKTFVEKGKSKRVTIHLDREAFSFYDTGCHAFNIEPGAYRIMVGASAEDIRISSEITIQ
ncbi:MAG: glycoside hydrolase family 3 C-terminal domain-containing protein, partial [Bacteroidales bacterium]|nr:glycoside hydrolase family 3 C-terminal domain-containing protein [Bacteroidales bacterium]